MLTRLTYTDFVSLPYGAEHRHRISDIFKRIFGEKKISWQKIYLEIAQSDESGEFRDKYDPHKFRVDGTNVVRRAPAGANQHTMVLVYWLYQDHDIIEVPSELPTILRDLEISVWSGRSPDEEFLYQQSARDRNNSAEDSFDFAPTSGPMPGGSSEYNHDCNIPSTDPPLIFPEEYQVDRDLVNWLDPRVTDSLEFVGRKVELEALDEFAASSELFQIWAMSGPSGAGKTRLVTEWIRRLSARTHVEDNSSPEWVAGFLTQKQLSLWKQRTEGWNRWLPSRNTVLVIDYIHLMETDITDIIDRVRALLSSRLLHRRIRLLLIDRIFPEHVDNILTDPRLRPLSSGGTDLHDLRRLFFCQKPMFLRHRDQGNLPTEIICHAARLHGRDLSKRELAAARRTLRQTGGAWCPLFAALIGRAIALGAKGRFGGRSELVRDYLRTTNRLPWLSPPSNHATSGYWIGAFVAATIAIGETSFRDMAQFLPSALKDDDATLEAISIRVRATVGTYDPDIVPPMEPDLLGEAYFLLFLERISPNRNNTVAFANLLVAICRAAHQKTSSDGYDRLLRLIGFFERASKNLLVDDDLEYTNPQWRCLLVVLQPTFFPEGSPIRAAVSVALVNLIEVLLEATTAHSRSDLSSLRAILASAFELVDYAALATAVTTPLAWSALLALAKLHTHGGAGTPFRAKIEPFVKAAFTDAAHATADRTGEPYTALFIACLTGFADVARLFVHEQKVWDCWPNRTTPLELAIIKDQFDVARLLIEETSFDINRLGPSGSLPLSIAATGGHIKIVEILLSQESIEINCSDGANGTNALVGAVYKGSEDVVTLLLADTRTDVNASGPDGVTPLRAACLRGWKEIVAMLLRHPKIEVDKATKDGATPLFVACEIGATSIARLLIDDQRVNLNQAMADGATPLIIACDRNHEDIVDMILKDPRIIQECAMIDGRTAMHIAAFRGQPGVVRTLLAHRWSNPNTSTPKGVTPLIAACDAGQAFVVKALMNFSTLNLNYVRAIALRSEYIYRLPGIHESMADHILGDVPLDVNCITNEGLTPLMMACLRKHVIIVNMLLQDPQIDVNKIGIRGATALHVAAEVGSIDICNRLLSVPGVKINAPMQYGTSPLLVAVQNGHADVVRALLSANTIDVAQLSTDGISPLQVAIERDDLNIVEMLINRAPHLVNRRFMDGSTPLIFAMDIGNMNMVKLLLLRANVNDSDDAGCSPLLVGFYRRSSEMIDLLLSYGHVRVNHQAENGATPLLLACQRGDRELVGRLARDSRIELNKTDLQGSSPLLVATDKGHGAIVEVLLRSGTVNCNASRIDGVNPLLMACSRGHDDIVELLLKRSDIDVNFGSGAVGTALYAACKFGHRDIVGRLLMRSTLDLNKTGPAGMTPLHQACALGDEYIVAMLLRDSRVDVNAQSWVGATPLLIATERRKYSTIELLLAHEQIAINLPTHEGISPLIAACAAGNVGIAHRLCAHPAIDVHSVSVEGLSALSAARQAGNPLVVLRILTTIAGQKRRNGHFARLGAMFGCSAVMVSFMASLFWRAVLAAIQRRVP